MYKTQSVRDVGKRKDNSSKSTSFHELTNDGESKDRVSCFVQ